MSSIRFSREKLIEEKRLILPVWYEVSKKDIFDYSPSLADRFAAIWEGNADDTARKLYPSITGGGGGNWFTLDSGLECHGTE